MKQNRWPTLLMIGLVFSLLSLASGNVSMPVAQQQPVVYAGGLVSQQQSGVLDPQVRRLLLAQAQSGEDAPRCANIIVLPSYSNGYLDWDLYVINSYPFQLKAHIIVTTSAPADGGAIPNNGIGFALPKVGNGHRDLSFLPNGHRHDFSVSVPADKYWRGSVTGWAAPGLVPGLYDYASFQVSCHWKGGSIEPVIQSFKRPLHIVAAP